MSVPLHPETTELGLRVDQFPPGSASKMRGVRDLSDIRQIHLLAVQLATGGKRDATMISIDELQALSCFAADAGAVFFAVMELFALSDFGERKAIVEKLNQLSDMTRPYFRSVA